MSKNSVLEQALLQVKNLEDAVKQNAKGILESTMKQELKGLLKEAEDEEEEVAVPDEEEDETGSEENFGSEGDDSGEEEEIDADDIGGEEADTDEFGGEDFGSGEDDEEEDVLDMTGASDGEVLKVFRAMKPEDGIVVKKDGNKIEVNTGDDEFIIKLNDEVPDFDPDVDGDVDTDVDTDVDAEAGMEDVDGMPDEDFGNLEGTEDETETEEDPSLEDELAESENEENVYEIEIDEEECDENLDECGDKNLPEEEVDEAARTKWNPHGDKGGANRAGLKNKKVFKAGSGVEINEELKTLRKQNVEYKKALNLFKEKLNEVAVFNANLAYATRLFTEQSTTKQEKLNILKRFDSIATLTESKGLYKTIKTELENKRTVSETVANKISNSPSTSTSKEMLSEAKAYENPQFARMKELMRKVR